MIKYRRCRKCNTKGYLADTYETCPICFGEGYIEETYRWEEDDDNRDADDFYC